MHSYLGKNEENKPNESSDFNIRLDGEIIPWLKENYSPKTRKFEPDKREDTGEDLLVVGEKMFFFRYPEVFDEKSTIPKLLQFDKEIARFNNSEVQFVECEG